MPLTEKGEEILSRMREEYGKDRGERVFYASKNAGTITGVDEMTGIESRLDAALDSMERADSKFSELVEKLEKEGKSKSYATKIAAKVGREKYGAHEMAEKAAASRGKHDSDFDRLEHPRGRDGKFSHSGSRARRKQSA